MIKTTLCFFLPLLMSLLVCCKQTKSVLSKEELKSYVRDKSNSLVKEQQVKEVKACLQYQPSSLLVAQEVEASQRKDKAFIDSLEKRYQASYYFLLSFSVKDKEAIRQLGSFDKYSDMVSVLSFEMPRFVNLTTSSKDTVELSDYYFDQTYGMSSANTVLLAFSKDKVKNSSAVDINLAECGLGIGSVKFSFRKQDLDQVPALDYSAL